jgi:hypothetical protein
LHHDRLHLAGNGHRIENHLQESLILLLILLS